MEKRQNQQVRQKINIKQSIKKQKTKYKSGIGSRKRKLPHLNDKFLWFYKCKKVKSHKYTHYE